MDRNTAEKFNDILIFPDIIKIKPITKGFSGDSKYYIETREGKRLLLRVAGVSEFKRHEAIYKAMKRVAEKAVPMGLPVDFGLCNNGKNVYQLLTWCEGEELGPVINGFNETMQYSLGRQAGEILKRIHSVPEKGNTGDWQGDYTGRVNDSFAEIMETGIRIEGSEHIIRYFNENKGFAGERPNCLYHGDYHYHNIIIKNNKDLFILDWETFGYGDPWYDFQGLNNHIIRPYYATGLVRGYFGGEPPEGFWRILALYLSAGALSLIPWAASVQSDEFGYDCLGFCIQNVKDILRFFDNMKNPVPSWYMK